ncbi:hypothetical protein [Aestuariimicrobium ganziense]|uniref:hypothetical protein n=1 Tax=Aestuariimicrobium ganziense TaxID=2773677 RepID=UPI00194295F7|nr:hypothetical protein [Aestuariimicrobium ganziense]
MSETRRSASLGLRLALWSGIIALLAIVVIVAALVGVDRFAPSSLDMLPVRAMVIGFGAAGAAAVIGMKRRNVINHHPPDGLDLAPNVWAHLAPWAVIAGLAIGWGLRHAADAVDVGIDNWLAVATVVVTLVAGLATLFGELSALRERATAAPAWSTD